MKAISDNEILGRFKFENPWWEGTPPSIDSRRKAQKPRAYLNDFVALLKKMNPNRAVVLMGPRRVGKSWMIHHAIQQLLDEGVIPSKIGYVSIDSPIYNGLGLENLVNFFKQATLSENLEGAFLFFDEIQYLKGWEIHLKKLVEDYPGAKFVASGSAAAALKLKSLESGAGRFTDFRLPPLTFHEYLYLLNKDNLVSENPNGFSVANISDLNAEFINYLNYGGYPEALFSPEIQADPQRFIRSDIIDKVLLRDLPQLYGIEDIQELNKLFLTLAYNSGDEMSLEKLSQGSGVAKNTIKRYLEYLQAAFLILIVHRIDQNGKHFKRANYFKIYLTNPSMRCALFGPVSQTHEVMGNLAETAVFSQWLHSLAVDKIFYARWPKEGKGEVDMVYHDGKKPDWCVEIKWSNAYFEAPQKLEALIEFSAKHKLEPTATTLSLTGKKIIHGVEIEFKPTSLYCYIVGLNTVRFRQHWGSPI